MIKRLFDIVVSLILIILLLPVFTVLAVLVRWKLGAPILFQQIRPGRGGKPFNMVKFRSMTAVKRGEPIKSDAERLTKFGKILRSSSLDELPELFNVLQGTMSLVGPRPLLMEYLPLYSQQQMRRHEMSPGITGWAQVNGRNSIGWEEKFELDVWYVDHHSFWLDMKILALTVKKVIVRDGVSANGEVTMGKFKGNDKP